jgi:hypothetical protein
MASLDGDPGPTRAHTQRAALRSAALAAVSLGVLGCGPQPTVPALADVLGHQRTVPLGLCSLNELSTGVTDIQCPAQHGFGFIPIVGFAALSFYFASAFLRKSGGYKRRASETALGMLVAIPGIFLCYVMYQALHAHRFVFDRPRQTVTHEAHILGSLVRSDVHPMRGARCTHHYSSGGKNRSSGWVIEIRSDGTHEHPVGRLRREPDAQALCRYLLAPTAATPGVPNGSEEAGR